MAVALGVVMDPVSGINIKKDTTFAMMLAAQARGWEIWYMELGDLYLADGRARARMARIEVRDEASGWYALSEREDRALQALDVVLMRKDPPVDQAYLTATWLLSIASSQGVLVLNPPSALRDCNEKLFATMFPDCCPPLLVSRNPAQLRAFHAQHGDIVLKPLDGMGGMSVFRVRPDDANLNVIIETLTAGHRSVMAQRYLPAIEQGDKRILLIDGKPIPYALARIPKAGENRGNLAAGGRGEVRPLSARDREICDRIGPELRRLGLWFVGIDVIGDHLTEINVTSPTCLREISRETGQDIAGSLMDAIASRLD